MPFPQNLECALQVEKVVQDHGAIPATIALLDGKLKVGLSHQELESLAKTGLEATKTSRRDLALVLAQKKTGSTTVSATMIAAKMAGIKVFVTGGIGGVHRGDDVFDVSADLTELGRTNVAVVCAGVKSILDIEKTLEYLETQGVTVVTHGQTNDFPSFYTQSSGFKSMAALSTTMEYANEKLKLDSGIVFACPIPKDQQVKDAEKFHLVIEKALQEAEKNGIKGKDTTPFLLGKVKSLSGGDSLRANIALVMNNASIGARIAKDYASIINSRRLFSTLSYTRLRPVIIGGSVLDISAKADTAEMNAALYTSSPGDITTSAGGVGRNITQVCKMAGSDPLFLSQLGQDDQAMIILEGLKKYEIDTSLIQIVESSSTAMYNSLFDCKGELVAAVADMKIHKHSFQEPVIQNAINNASLLVLDGNNTIDTLYYAIRECSKKNIGVLFEPTSVPKSSKLVSVYEKMVLEHKKYGGVSIITPDYHETLHLATLFSKSTILASQVSPSSTPQFNESQIKDIPTTLLEAIQTLSKYIPTIIVKNGKRGCIVCTRRLSSRNCTSGEKPRHVYQITQLPPSRSVNVVNVSGAGDSLVGVVAAILGKSRIDYMSGHEAIVKATRKGMEAAQLTCEAVGISELINSDLLK